MHNNKQRETATFKIIRPQFHYPSDRKAGATIYNKVIQDIQELSGQNVHSCVHCGKCSAACPFTEWMDVLPDQIIRNIQLGRIEETETITPWICASCYACMAACPMGIDISKLMNAVKEKVKLRKGEDWTRIDELPETTVREMPQILLVSNFRKYTR